jgi:hypothetical protein
MKSWRIMIIILFGLLLSACTPTTSVPCDEQEECPICDECEVCEECPVNPFPEGLVLPQIYIQGKIFWTEADLLNLRENVIDPIIEYFEEQEQTVVSIVVNNATSNWTNINSIIVEVMISDNDGNEDPLYMGMVIDKVDGVFPVWEQESMGP